MDLKPLGDRLIVEPLEEEETENPPLGPDDMKDPVFAEGDGPLLQAPGSGAPSEPRRPDARP